MMCVLCQCLLEKSQKNFTNIYCIVPIQDLILKQMGACQIFNEDPKMAQ